MTTDISGRFSFSNNPILGLKPALGLEDSLLVTTAAPPTGTVLWLVRDDTQTIESPVPN